MYLVRVTWSVTRVIHQHANLLIVFQWIILHLISRPTRLSLIVKMGIMDTLLGTVCFPLDELFTGINVCRSLREQKF